MFKHKNFRREKLVLEGEMIMANKMKYTNNNKKSDGRFRKKHIDYDPQDESSRAKFGTMSEKHLD